MMLCRKPFTKDGAAYPCGQCMPCRYNKRREWTNRLMLESLCHPYNVFFTLTYDDANLPGTGSLVPDHLQLWLKRFRLRVYPNLVRFFAVGEYGDKSGRPHYHGVMFNQRGCEHVFTRYPDASRRCCSICELFTDSWGKGNVFLGRFELHSAEYICGYVVKKMTRNDDERLLGRHPEFSRMSRDPGIGVNAMWDVASTMLQYGLDERTADVPSAVQMGKKVLPYGRTLRRKLRVMIGRDANAPKESTDAIKAELQPVRDFAFNNSLSFSKTLAEIDDGRYATIVARNEIFKKRVKL